MSSLENKKQNELSEYDEDEEDLKESDFKCPHSSDDACNRFCERFRQFEMNGDWPVMEQFVSKGKKKSVNG